MMIFGIPILHIVTGGLTALGAYNFARWAVNKVETDKARIAEAQRVLHMVETAAEYGATIYAELKNPLTRQAEVKKIAEQIHSFIDLANAPPTPSVQG